MTVRELINLLKNEDQNKIIIINMGMRGEDREVDGVENLDETYVGIKCRLGGGRLMTYEERIAKTIVDYSLNTPLRPSPEDLARTIALELQAELYLVDHLLAQVDPSQAEFTGECPLCTADVTQDSTETHEENCPLVEVIMKQQPHDCLIEHCKPCVEGDSMSGRIHTKSKCTCKETRHGA